MNRNQNAQPTRSSVFASVFARLRQILEKYSDKLAVAEDTPKRYCLQCGLHPKHKQPMPLAWVLIGKNYVSFHLMPVYGCPQLLDNVSKKLKARMQGKSCFNFKTIDEALFQELDELTNQGISAFKRAGFLP